MAIHPTAIIDPRASIDPSADIGPYVVIEGEVRIGPRTQVMAHACIVGWTEIGSDNRIHYGAVLGDLPQDLKYSGAPSYVRIGDHNVFREHTQVHRGTAPGSETRIGSRNFFMVNAHVGHNSRVGDGVVMANGAMLGGHVEVHDQAFISGNCAVHQFARVGRLALMRGLSRASRDVPPFCISDDTHTLRAINRVGLKRAGFSAEQIRDIQRAFVHLFLRPGNLALRIAELQQGPVSPEVQEIFDFVAASKRGVGGGRRQPSSDG